MFNDIYDRTLRDYSQKILDELSPEDKLKVKTIRNCGKRIIAPSIGEPGVFLLSNGSKAKFFGSTHCGNMFACPTCTARAMQKFAHQIGAGIDELKKDYFGIMITLTVPHLYYMKQRETTDILYNTFKRFRLAAKGGRTNPIKTLFKSLEIKHWVAICEYTFGKNGWHPHFHCIFWCKRDKASQVLDWEQKLNDWWLERAKYYTLDYWKKNNLHFKSEEKMTAVVEKLFSSCERNAGLVIGKKNNKIREAQSGDYICGWGAESELTGLSVKTAKNDHYTPYQILQLAAQGDSYYKKVWCSFVLSVRQQPIHRRVIWSHTNISCICRVAYQKVRCTELLKKNTDENWQVLLWFSKEQWYCLKQIPYAESNILFVATYCREILLEFLDTLNIDYNLPSTSFIAEHIQNIFNSAA